MLPAGHLFWVSLLALLSSCLADLFTSVADLQRLLHVEKNIPQIIDEYISAERKRLEELKR